MKSNNICAIIISEDHYNALGIIRSLGEKGIRVLLLLLSSGKSFIEKSKYVNQCFRVGKQESSIVDQLRIIATENELGFVFPLSDYAALVLDKCYSFLPSNLIVPHMNQKMWIYQNKEMSKQYAVKAGLSVPRGRVININEFNNEVWDSFPAIIKPLASIEGLKSDISIVKNQEQFKDIISVFRKHNYEKVLIEEYITGTDSYMIEVMGYSVNGEASFTGIIKKIREYPFFNGSTSFAEIISSHAELNLEALKKYIRASNFSGLFDVEFKYCDGNVYFIECNFRNGAPNYAITTILGINTPFEWICEYLNESETKEYVIRNAPKKFMVEQTDILNMIKGAVSFPKWIKDYFMSKKIFWKWTDPIPCLSYYKRLMSIAINRFFSKRRK